MFGMGMPELIIILVIALIVIGPKKLPDLAKALGKGMSEFRKATQEIKENLNIDEELKEAKEDLIDAVSGLDKAGDTAQTASSGQPETPDNKRPVYQDFDEMLEDYENKKEGMEKQETPGDQALVEKGPEDAAEKSRYDG